METSKPLSWIRVAPLAELTHKGIVVVQGEDRPIAVVAHEGRVDAVDNRCPHLGFPLHKGSVKDGILTCHWHQARFDLCSGCTFDPWADDVPSFETKVTDGVVFVAALPRRTPDAAYHIQRLHKGMLQNISLLQAKSLIGWLKHEATPLDVVREAALYGAKHLNSPGGVTDLTIAGTLSSVVTPETSYFLLLRGTREVAMNAMNSTRQVRQPLEGHDYPFSTLKRWFYQWVKVRDREAAERALLTAVKQCTPAQLADMLFGAISQRVYANQGHLFDFANKQFELLDLIGWEHAEQILPLQLPQIVAGGGAEESGAWQHPIDLITPLRTAEEQLPDLLNRRESEGGKVDGQLAAILLGDDPIAIIDGLKAALAAGVAPAMLSRQVAYSAAMRLARFAKSNEVGDWFNPQHTFTYANAVHHAVKRSPTPDVVRAIFHAALSVYMDRFLNVPPAKLPGEVGSLDALPRDGQALRNELLKALDERSNLEEATRVVSRYWQLRLPIEPLFDTLAFATVREDLDFHTLQVLEAGYQQYRQWGDRPEGEHILLGVIRDLSAFCPTRRANLKTATTALRLHRGDKIFEEDERAG